MRLAILADDLTGALDTGVQFHRHGLATRVLIQPAPDAPLPDTEILVIDTETRHSSDNAAADLVAHWGRRLRTVPLYKKIDSTLRGPWRAEVAALSQVREEPVLICPAYAAQGRRVRDGAVFVQERNIGALSYPSRSNDRIADAETDADLDLLAEALEAEPWIGVGSAGLAAALARRWSRGPAAAPQPHCRRTLVVAGSRSAVSREQVRGLRPDSQTLLTAPQEESPAVAETLARNAAVLHARDPFDSLVLTGGDTAIATLRALGVTEVELAAEVLPGIPAAILKGGVAAGAWAVTKAGAFGEPEALLRIIEWLQR